MKKQMLLEDHIRKNKQNTVIICTFMALLFLGVIFAFGYIYFQNPYIAFIFGLPIALCLHIGN